MRPSALTCAAAMVAALTGQARAIAQTAAPSDVQRLIDEEKRHPHWIAPVEVRTKRKNMISPVEVRATRKCLKARRPADPDIPPPKLVSTFPANGAVVRPGLMVLRLTFDLPMACAGLIDDHAPLPNPCPGPLREPVISLDRRTFLTVCQVAKDSHYGLRLNARTELRFTSLAGHVSQPYELVFDTSAEPELATVQDAIAEDAWLRSAMRPVATPASTVAKDN
jgi:hypothetical protein